MNTSLFTLTNLYIFLIEFAFSVLFLIVFSSLHYGLTKTTRLGSIIETSKISSFTYFFIFGFILSSLTFVVSQICKVAVGVVGMPLTILGLIFAMTVFYHRSVQIGAIIPTILWVLYEYGGFAGYNIAWLSRVLIILIFAGVAIATTFIKWKPWPLFLLSCLTALIAIIILIVCIADENRLYFSLATFVSILSTVLYYAIIKRLNKMLTRMSTMAEEGTYVDKYYLIPSVLNDSFLQYIKRNNLSQALVVSFTFDSNDKNKDKLLNQLHSFFATDKALFFKSEYNTYGVVLSGKNYFIQNLNESFRGNKLNNRSDYDGLKLLESKLSVIKQPIKAHISIYGVHSCNLNELLKFNDFLRKHDNQSSNIVQLFSSQITLQEIIDDIAYTTLVQKVNLSDIDVKLELIKMNKSKKIYVCPRFYWPKLLTCDIETILSQFEPSVADTLLRTLAIRSIEQYANSSYDTKYPLLIYYPINQLNNSLWSANNLENKIRLFGVHSNNIILSFNIRDYSYLPRQIVSSLIDLQKNNIMYFLVNVKSLSSLRHVKPSGVILDRNLSKQINGNNLSNIPLL